MTAQQWRDRALAAKAAGNLEEAEVIFAQGIAACPDSAALLNSAGSFLAAQGRHAEASVRFDQALAIDPAHAEAFLNRAISWANTDSAAKAMAGLVAKEKDFRPMPRYWAVRAGIGRDHGLLDDAAKSYDALLKLQADHSRGLHGRARIALERGEDTMCARFERALPHNRADATAFLGYAQALACAGRLAEARELVETLLAQIPAWTEALCFLAQLRWGAGEGERFCDHFALAATAVPHDPAIPLAWANALAGTDRYLEAADVVSRARATLPDHYALVLAEADYAGAAGQLERAGRILATLPDQTPARKLLEARHRLRLHDPVSAEALLEQVILELPDTISAWALRDLAWRMMDDSRREWLHGQPGLYAQRSLGLDAGFLADIINLLREMHAKSLPPVGQSVRSGSQTWGGLFDRTEPELRVLREAIADLMSDFRAGLPPKDSTHPLLRYRDQPWRLRGSWSIRMMGEGRHTEHVHPQGILSSAIHLVVPEDAGLMGAGCLELGRSPPDLGIDLPPVVSITPVEGHAVLFPSTLYHGTCRFTSGERLSVAFDVAPQP